MQVFSKAAICGLEQQAVEQGISLSQLMERAGEAVAEALIEKMPDKGKRIIILCGKGNNGGDGYVAAKVLQAWGAQVTVVLVEGTPASPLAQEAFSRLPQGVSVVSRESACPAIEEAEAIVDCVYGFSFRGELEPEVQGLFQQVAQLPCFKLSCDLPSGVHCDWGTVSPGAFQADLTITFTGHKVATCSYPAKAHCGEVRIAWVGIPAEALDLCLSPFSLTQEESCQGLLPVLSPEQNKGDGGRLLLVCGSYGMIGAAMMAGRAALRCGVGLLELAVDGALYPLLAPLLPEAVFTVLDWTGDWEAQLERSLSRCSACLIGCGLGTLAETLSPLVFARCEKPLVVDADALNFLAAHPLAWKRPQGAGGAVLTPHPGEMARLCSCTVSEIQGNRWAQAGALGEKLEAVVVLKGAATVVAAPDGRRACNPTGNPGMAKGGSGDVLAGMIASFLAQGVPPWEAGVLGAYYHGLAGDLGAEKFSQRALLPTDLLSLLPQVFL